MSTWPCATLHCLNGCYLSLVYTGPHAGTRVRELLQQNTLCIWGGLCWFPRQPFHQASFKVPGWGSGNETDTKAAFTQFGSLDNMCPSALKCMNSSLVTQQMSDSEHSIIDHPLTALTSMNMNRWHMMCFLEDVFVALGGGGSRTFTTQWPNDFLLGFFHWENKC